MFCISSLQALLSSAIDVLLLMSVDSREYFCYNFTVIHLILSRSVVECVYQRICHKQLSLSSPEPTCFISGRPVLTNTQLSVGLLCGRSQVRIPDRTKKVSFINCCQIQIHAADIYRGTFFKGIKSVNSTENALATRPFITLTLFAVWLLRGTKVLIYTFLSSLALSTFL